MSEIENNLTLDQLDDAIVKMHKVPAQDTMINYNITFGLLMQYTKPIQFIIDYSMLFQLLDSNRFTNVLERY